MSDSAVCALCGDADGSEAEEHERSPQHRAALADRFARATFAAGRASGIEAAAEAVDDAAVEREADAVRLDAHEGERAVARDEAQRLRALAATIRALPVTT